MTAFLSDNFALSITVALAALAAIGYLLSHFRQGKAEFTLTDAMILGVIVAILAAAAVPVLEAASYRAREATLQQNLHVLRSQIELYQLEHGSDVPVVYEGSFPQLIRATNAAGIPGVSGKNHPYGPYLQGGMPVNPFSGRSIVTLTDVFPPTAPSGNGGWLYHQPTGRIVPDHADFLDR